MRSEGTSGHWRAWCVVFMWFVLGSDGHGALLFRVGFCCFLLDSVVFMWFSVV